jgi:hypothetical protein
VKLKSPILVAAIAGLICVLFLIGVDFFWLWLDAAFSEAPISYVWREQGRFKGHFGLISDLQLAADPDSVVSERAASRLLIKRQCDKADGMIQFLESENRRNVRRWVMQALAACGDRRAIPYFRAALHSEDQMLIGVGAQSLGMLKAREAIPELEAIVEQGISQCDGAAAFALSQMGEKQIAYPWAVKMLSADRPDHDPKSVDSFRRMYAGQILEEIGREKDIPLIEKNRSALGVGADYYVQAIRKRDSGK